MIQPKGCSLPPFSPRKFLHAIQGRSVNLVGDSLVRNMFDSLVCMLSAHPQVLHETPLSPIPEVPEAASVADVHAVMHA
jgi:hypothetical protein